MPFKSDSQRKLCYLLKGKGQAGSWDCDEWSTATGKRKLPEHVADQEEKQALNKKSGVSSLISKWSAMSGCAQYPTGLLKGAAGGPPPRMGGYKPPSVFSTPPRLAVGAPPVGPPPVGPTAPATGTPAPATGTPAPATGTPAPAAAATPPPSGVMGYANQAWDAAKSGVSGVMGNVQSSPAYNNAALAYQHRGAIAPTAWNAVQAGFGSDEAKTKLDADANRFNWSALKDNATKAWNDPSTQAGFKKMEQIQVDHYKRRLTYKDKKRLAAKYDLGYVEQGQALLGYGKGYDRIVAGETAKIKGDMSKWTAGLGDSISKSPFGAAANYVGTGVKNYATQSEAKRMTAQATMPYVDWMRANPWAKYVGGGLALGAGAYGLHKLFGGGGASEADTDEGEGDNVLTKSFNRGLNPAPVGRSKRYW